MRATSIQALLALSREVQRRHYVGADAGERAREEVLQLELHFRRRALGAQMLQALRQRLAQTGLEVVSSLAIRAATRAPATPERSVGMARPQSKRAACLPQGCRDSGAAQDR